MPATRGRPTLPIAAWPASDRDLWLAACRPALRLTRGGAASRMNPKVQLSYARAYDYFLEHCRHRGLLDGAGPAAGLVTSDTINDFIRHLEGRVSSVTQWSYLQRILRVASILAPERDFEWLREVVADLKDRARSRSKAHRIIDSARLLELGLSLI